MTSAEWDAHERMWCESCAFSRKCPVKEILHKDPSDTVALAVIERLGRCSQHKPKPKRKNIRS